MRKYAVIAFNLMLLWGAWYMSGYGVMVGRSGNLGRNCNYLTARGLFDQNEVSATAPSPEIPVIDNCAAIYGFEARAE
ncbi:MAG: YobH family protein [Bdellovibrionales bacterium]